LSERVQAMNVLRSDQILSVQLAHAQDVHSRQLVKYQKRSIWTAVVQVDTVTYCDQWSSIQQNGDDVWELFNIHISLNILFILYRYIILGFLGFLRK